MKMNLKNPLAFYENSLIFFNIMTKELNLNSPGKSLKNIINDNKYLEFIFSYTRLKIFLFFIHLLKVNLKSLFKYINI